MFQVHCLNGTFKDMLYGLCRGLFLFLLVVATGCSGSAAKHEPRFAREAGQAKPAMPGKSADSEVNKALAKLPPEDRKLAETQRVCPVSNEPLGSMGVPVKVTVKDRVVFLCCGGCEEELKKNADKYLAKLEN